MIGTSVGQSPAQADYILRKVLNPKWPDSVTSVFEVIFDTLQVVRVVKLSRKVPYNCSPITTCTEPQVSTSQCDVCLSLFPNKIVKLKKKYIKKRE